MQADCLIVGAGPVGLTLANLLAKEGISFRIIDKKSSTSVHSKAMVVHSRTLELLDSELGLVDKFFESGNKIKKAQIFADDKQIVNLDLTEIPSKFSFTLGISQSDTEKILEESLNEKGFKVEWEAELKSLKDASAYKYIFACDGAHSICRKDLGLEFSGKSYKQEFFLADLMLENDLEQSSIYAFLTENNLAFLAPFKEKGHWRLITIVEPGYEGDRENPSIEDVYNLVETVDALRPKITSVTWLSYFHVHCRIVDSYEHGKVYLLGDSAHIHSPVGGKGMNAGMQDAFNLVKHLKNNSLELYNQERRPVGLDILKTTDSMTNFILARSKFSHQLQKFFVPKVISIPFFRKKILRNLAMLD